MSTPHFDPSELDREDATLDAVAERLERYAASTADAAPSGLANRITAAIDAEPQPARGVWASVLTAFAMVGPVARAGAVTAVAVVAIVGAMAFASLVDRGAPDVGASPIPTRPPVPGTPTPTPTPTPSPTPTPTPTPSPTVRPATPVPSPSDDDESETPRPSESGNSGPGGGGDDGGSDSSNPGSGDD